MDSQNRLGRRLQIRAFELINEIESKVFIKFEKIRIIKQKMRQKFYFRLLFLFVSLDEIEFFVYNVEKITERGPES